MEKKYIFYLRHIKNLLQSEFMFLQGGGTLYYFSQGIIVEIDNISQQRSTFEQSTIEIERFRLQEKRDEQLQTCSYQLLEREDKNFDKIPNSNISKKYIVQSKRMSEVYLHQGEVLSKTQEEYEITHVERFDSFQDIFVCHPVKTWKTVDSVVILFSDIEEAFPFMDQVVSLKGAGNFMEGRPLGTDIFVGEAKMMKRFDPSPNHRKSYFMMHIENPTTFFVLRLQKYFASSFMDEASLRGIYEKYTSKQSSFYVPFQSEHRLFEYIQPIEDISRRIFTFIQRHIGDQVSLQLEWRDLEEFISYQLPAEHSDQKLNAIEEQFSDKDSTDMENQEHLSVKKKVVTKIPIYVNTRKTRHVYPTVAWFFEDIELNELQKHLSYITEEDIKRKKIHYIFAEECLDIDVQQNHAQHSMHIQPNTNQHDISKPSKKNRSHLLIFSLESIDIDHPTFVKIGRPLQKPFVDQNIFIMIDEVFSPQITSLTAQHVFQLYREDDFACVFLGSRSFVFPKRLQSLGDISQHVLSQQQTRLHAYIEQSLWKLQEWIHLPTIPRNPYILSQSEGIHRHVSSDVFDQAIIADKDDKSEKGFSTIEATIEKTIEKKPSEGEQSIKNKVPFGEKQREDFLLNDLSPLLGQPTKEEELRLYALLYSFLQDKLPYMVSQIDIHRKSIQQME